MRKIILILILIFGIMGSLSVFAYGVEEELKGKVTLEKLEAKETICEDLTDADFEALGEYFMGQMMGTSHEAMNKMMEQMMGKVGEEKMHVAMGKRMSNCEPNAQMPENMPALSGVEGMPMMMGSGMMGNFGPNPQSWPGRIFLFSAWVLIVVAIFALIKWLIKKSK